MDIGLLCDLLFCILGFSFGGVLACYIAACLWEESFLSIKQLQSSLTCITFGQPFLEIPYIKEAINHFCDLKYTFYNVYDEEDLFPFLVQYYAFLGEKHSSAVPKLQQMFAQKKVHTLLCI